MKTAILLLALLGAACVEQGQDYVVVPSAMGMVKVEAPVKDALIYVDDFFAGTVGGAGQRGFKVQEGVRRIEIRHERYHSYYQVVRVGRDQTTVVHAVLREVLE